MTTSHLCVAVPHQAWVTHSRLNEQREPSFTLPAMREVAPAAPAEAAPEGAQSGSFPASSHVPPSAGLGACTGS